jgi:hypothetical protein
MNARARLVDDALPPRRSGLPGSLGFHGDGATIFISWCTSLGMVNNGLMLAWSPRGKAAPALIPALLLAALAVRRGLQPDEGGPRLQRVRGPQRWLLQQARNDRTPCVRQGPMHRSRPDGVPTTLCSRTLPTGRPTRTVGASLSPRTKRLVGSRLAAISARRARVPRRRSRRGPPRRGARPSPRPNVASARSRLRPPPRFQRV